MVDVSIEIFCNSEYHVAIRLANVYMGNKNYCMGD